ncbi:hypothetical protein LEP1GSC050_2914 [Leptospira broomii serovar Hurstbridge str. 5399]|uniref:Uncharacterized protein n=1 Tax=Leptospira broomii serovar Hurstbridge str. 5399 TaxID=1049789 RepID=T0FBS2_9LEPT|nr:hypothetical protein [Leptospira broomii]EQA45017.1 hypothetical protein LEP1GSC050_2914 [Leptospira broomii serovar Hurstbridge str. 5399]
MKVNKIISLLLVAGFLAGSSIFAVSQDTEDRLLEQALVSAAVTKEQKIAVGTYLKALAQQKSERAEELRALAKRSTGGKFLASNAQSAKFLKQAAALEREAQKTQEFLNNL